MLYSLTTRLAETKLICVILMVFDSVVIKFYCSIVLGVLGMWPGLQSMKKVARKEDFGDRES